MDRTARRTWADRLRFWIRIVNRVEVLELRWLGVSGVSLLRRRDVLVLETVGRRTGKRRRSPVTYLRDDDGPSYRIGGGAGGMTRVDWVANLRSRDRAAVYVRRRRQTVHVQELHGEERDRAHGAAAARWPEVLKYEPMSNRQIPYFRLTPVTDEGR
jgi:deazaflavin-dependent oxidoreductase (nitroreductase family)